MFGKRKQTHSEMTEELRELEYSLENQATEDYSEKKEELKNCSKCNIPPKHSYDSFGMPMHKLQCPKCSAGVEVAKSWDHVKEEWNLLQSKGNSQFKITSAGECGHYDMSYQEKLTIIRKNI